jgi:hypothetical protein
MNDHPSGLVDDDDISVLVDDGKRDQIGQDLVDPRIGNLHRHDFARRHAELGLSLLPVDANSARFNEALDGCAAQAGELVRDVPIQARTEIVACRMELNELVAFLFSTWDRKAVIHQLL